MSHPLCEDVDWNAPVGADSSAACRSSSVRGCGLKCIGRKRMIEVEMSSSMRGCGLKLVRAVPIQRLYGSSSMRGCGLKFTMSQKKTRRPYVILYARMWIEISGVSPQPAKNIGHPLCEDVDWNLCRRYDTRCPARSSFVRGCGLKCFHGRLRHERLPGHPPCEDVDWNGRCPMVP